MSYLKTMHVLQSFQNLSYEMYSLFFIQILSFSYKIEKFTTLHPAQPKET